MPVTNLLGVSPLKSNSEGWFDGSRSARNCLLLNFKKYDFLPFKFTIFLPL